MRCLINMLKKNIFKLILFQIKIIITVNKPLTLFFINFNINNSGPPFPFFIIATDALAVATDTLTVAINTPAPVTESLALAINTFTAATDVSVSATDSPAAASPSKEHITDEKENTAVNNNKNETASAIN